MPINAPWDYPTLMRTPPGGAGGVFPPETVLPLETEAYAVTREGEIWQVTVKRSGVVLHEGPGPVVLVESPAPLFEWLASGQRWALMQSTAGPALQRLQTCGPADLRTKHVGGRYRQKQTFAISSEL